MLNKLQAIMDFIITSIVMNIFQDLRTFKSCWPKFKVHFVCDMNQNIDLEVIPMHILHFILCFECIIFTIIYAKEDRVFKDAFKKSLEFLIRQKTKEHAQGFFNSPIFL